MGIKEEYISFREDLINIANAIREKKGLKRKMTMSEMIDILRKDDECLVLFDGDEDTTFYNMAIRLLQGGYKSIEGEVSFEEIPSAKYLIPYAFNADDNSSTSTCPYLSSLKLGTIETVGSYSCCDCIGLTHVYAPNVKKIENGAFSMSSTNKSNLVYFDAPKLEEIGDFAFNAYGYNKGPVFEYLNIPNIKKVGTYGFSNANFEELNAPFLETIGDRAFSDNSLLKRAIIPKVKRIPSNAFSSCPSLEEIDFSSVEVLMYCLYNTVALKEIHLPKIKTVSETFSDSGVEKIYIENEKEICNFTAFISNKTIYVPNHFLNEYKNIYQLQNSTILPLSEVQ